MVTLSALVSDLDAELVRLGYKASTMVWYRGCWRRLERFFAARGVEEFSLDLAMAWVDEACGFFDKEQAGTLKPTDVYLFRVAQMLGDYAVHGAVLRRYSRSGRASWPGTGPTRSPDSRRGCGPPTGPCRPCGRMGRWPGSSSRSWTPAAGLARCDAGAVEAFVATLAGYQFKTVEQKLCAVRSFLQVRVRRRPGRRRRAGRGPGGDVPQAGQDPVGVGSGRRGQDPGRGRPGQPVREAGLRDHFAGHQARAARHRRQTAGVLRLRLAGQPAVRQCRPRPATGCSCRC